MYKKEEDKLVVKANHIVEASYSLTLQEQRIILYMASQIKPNDDDFKPIRLSISAFKDLIQINNNSQYNEIQEITKRLRKRDLIIKQQNTTLQTGWLSSAKYFNGEGYVELRFDPNLKPYLLQLKERFTKYKLQHIIKMSHSYSIRFYELLKQYESIGWRYFKLDELMGMLGIKKDEYKLYAHFKARVIQPVKAEFDEKYKQKAIEFTFEFEEQKKVRKVIGLRFEIKKPQQIAKEKVEKTTETPEDLLEKLMEIKLTIRQAKSLIKKYPAERILRNIELTKQKNAQGEVNNLPAFLIEAIENDYAKDYKPSNSAKLATLRAEAKKCWSKNLGSCRVQWSTYKDDRSSACHFCAKFEKQRSL
jgi:plasmid replication initiation protein